MISRNRRYMGKRHYWLSRAHLRFDLRQAMFVIPNFFTLSSIFCGFFAMTVCLQATRWPGDIRRAAMAIFFGMFFDMADGRIARLTRTQSDFGMQLDSLADIVTFGLAPALLMYSWAFGGMSRWGFLVGFVYLAAGTIRLARFNVLNSIPNPRVNQISYFIGLPIPAAAGTLAAMVLVVEHYGFSIALKYWVTSVVSLLLSYLMISTWQYRTFKDFQINGYRWGALGLLLGVGACVAYWSNPAVVLLCCFGGYILLGILSGLGGY